MDVVGFRAFKDTFCRAGLPAALSFSIMFSQNHPSVKVPSPSSASVFILASLFSHLFAHIYSYTELDSSSPLVDLLR